MRSRRDLLIAAAIVAALSIGDGNRAAAQAQETAPQAAAGRPDDGEIERALAKVKADPNLATERTVKTLRWGQSTQPKSSGTPAWLMWIAGLFSWLEQSARTIVWGVAAVLIVALVVFVVRLFGRIPGAAAEEPFAAPTHVRELDIRPESLPDDIGAAARALWDRGEHRASLALLYRGLLSRLVHVHRIAIRDSSTEGDCLVLAAAHLPQKRHAYASSLVTLWQRAVYGREAVSAETVYAVCDGFAAALAPAAAPEPLRERRS